MNESAASLPSISTIILVQTAYLVSKNRKESTNQNMDLCLSGCNVYCYVWGSVPLEREGSCRKRGSGATVGHSTRGVEWCLAVSGCSKWFGEEKPNGAIFGEVSDSFVRSNRRAPEKSSPHSSFSLRPAFPIVTRWQKPAPVHDWRAFL